MVEGRVCPWGTDVTEQLTREADVSDRMQSLDLFLEDEGSEWYLLGLKHTGWQKMGPAGF